MPSAKDTSSKTSSYAEALRGTSLRYERVVQALSILRQMDELDDPACNVDEICRRILETIAFGLGAESCSLMLLDGSGRFFERRATYSPLADRGLSHAPEVWPGQKVPIGEGIVGRSVQTEKAIRIDDVTQTEDTVSLGERPPGLRSLLCFPLGTGGKPIGALTLGHSEPDSFCEDSERIMTLIAARACRIFTSHLLRQELVRYRDHLEELVAERNAELIKLNEDLEREIAERKANEEERRRLEEQIRHAQKLESLGIMAGGIAHDFNNLLMGILGNAELLLDDIPEPSPARARVTEIEAAVQRATDLCQQMLAYSGKGQFVIESIDLNTLVKEMARLLEVSVAKNASLVHKLADTSVKLMADAAQLRQAIVNVVVNASEALGEDGGTITITTGEMVCDRDCLRNVYLNDDLCEGTYVYVEVTDTGCGMDEETLSKAFEPFFTTKFTGRGLGLPAVLGIVRGHRGAISVKSEPGRGSTFRILFPATDQATKQILRNVASPRDAFGGETILLVDDEQAIRAIGKRVLETMGFKVLTAKDGHEGVKAFREHAGEIDLVMLDLTMPRMGGEEALREMRRVKSDIRVILCSGHANGDGAVQYIEQGVVEFIQKPFNRAELSEKLRALLSPRE